MRIGLMGGTFDPIHWGHIHMAKAAADELGLDKVIFLPDGDPPHKAPQTPGAFRLRMAQLAAELDPRFDSSDRELRRKGRTYTVDTLEEYKALCPDRRMIYIVGSDTLRLFPSWRTAHKVAQLCDMAVVLRRDDTRESIQAFQKELERQYGLHSTLLSAEGLDISSSMVRQKLREGGDIASLVPPGVAALIAGEKLYR